MKKTFFYVCVLVLSFLLMHSLVIAQRSQHLNFQKLAFFNNRNEGQYYLAVLSSSPKTDPKNLDTSNLHIRFETSKGRKLTIENESLVIVNLGEMSQRFAEKFAKKYTFFRFNLVIDNSRSIDDMELSFVEKAIEKFIRNLPVCYEAQVIKFSDDIKKSNFTKNPNELIQYINEPFQRKGTALHDAIADSITELKFQGTDAFRFAVIFTDGKENKSKKYKDEIQFKKHITSECKKNQIPLFIIGVTDSVDSDLLMDITIREGLGFYEWVRNFPDIDKAFTVMQEVIQNTYLFKIPSITAFRDVNRIDIVSKSPLTGKFKTIQDIYVNIK